MKHFVPENESDHLLRCLRVIEYRVKIDHDLIVIELDGRERRLNRSIPADAGNTASPSDQVPPVLPVHPRGCGEYS